MAKVILHPGTFIPVVLAMLVGAHGCAVHKPELFSSKSASVQQTETLPAAVHPAKALAEDLDRSKSQDGLNHVELASYELLQIAGDVPMSARESSSGYTLEDLETLALTNNPTLKQLSLSAAKAAGFRTQVGLRPNPNLGYSGQQLADRGTDQHTAFVEKEIVTGGKLALNQNVLNAAVRQQLCEVQTRQARIKTDVRVAYMNLLAARKKETTLQEFADASKRAVELTELRKRAKEGSQIDVLQATTQLNQVLLQKAQAEVASRAFAKELSAITGVEVTPDAVVGVLDASGITYDWDSVFADLRDSNPEFQVALANRERAAANWRRQNIQRSPNLTFQLGAGVDKGTDSGMINTQLSAPLAIYNRNQGNIAAAYADFCIAQLELERIERSMQARLASISGEFEAAKAARDQYETNLIPDIEKTLELANQAYVAGEVNFLEVLIIRRNYFELRLQSIDAIRDLLIAQMKSEGFGLTGGLDSISDASGDPSLRDQSFSQQ